MDSTLLLPRVVCFDLLVELFRGGVESAQADRTTHRGLGFDIADGLAVADAGGEVALLGVGRVV